MFIRLRATVSTRFPKKPSTDKQGGCHQRCAALYTPVSSHLLLIRYPDTTVHEAHMAFGLMTHNRIKGPYTLACEGVAILGRKATIKQQVTQLLISAAAEPNISMVKQQKQGVPLELVPSQVLLNTSTDPHLPENKGALTADTPRPPGYATSMR